MADTSHEIQIRRNLQEHNAPPEMSLNHQADFDAAEPILSVLRSRRSIFNFQQRRVPEELLTAALDLGRFAPNHKLTEPWRFIVPGELTRKRIETEWADFAASRLPADVTPERREEARRTSLGKIGSKPALVIVTQLLDPDPFRCEEDFAAVAAAIQNIQLAAWALGLGCQWSTSPATVAPGVLAAAEVPSSERVVGFLFLGFPAVVPDAVRKPLDAVLRRLP